MKSRTDATSAPSPRYHGLDGLRASMMLLGVVLHSTLSYGRNYYGEGWAFQDAHTHPAFDLIFAFIHVFRMPVFFVMAGFFGGLIYDRRGSAEMLRNRAKRVLLPLVVSWPILFPFYKSGVPFSSTARDSSFAAGFVAVGEYLTDGSLFERLRPMHLWFLIYLLYFYAIALLLTAGVHRIPATWRATIIHRFTGLLRSRWTVVWFAVPMTAVLVLTGTDTSVTPYAFTPDLNALLFYGAFFGFGWLLYGARESLNMLGRGAWMQTLLGTLLFGLQYAGLRHLLYTVTGYAPFAHSLSVANNVLAVWLLLFGTTGLFLRYLEHPEPRWRYLADASYWLYLIHLPLTIWLPGWLSRLDWPAWLKFVIVVGLTAAVGLVSYEFLVRRTFLNQFLGSRTTQKPPG